MKLGLTCPRFVWPGGDAAIAARFADVARGAEEAGLDSFWVMDHLFQIPNFGAAEDPMLEAYSALSYAAALTRRVTLGTLVTCVTYRQPGLLLKQVTTLDVLSGGRAVLGIGAEFHEEEHRGLGFRLPPVAERFERLEETLRIAKRMWTAEDTPYEGRHYRLARTLNSPQALSRPHPPILIGGSGEKKTLRLVARYGDACNLFLGADVTRKLGVLRAHCEAEGRPYEAIEKTLHMRVPEGQSVGESVQRCGELAGQGIDHVIVAMPDPSTDASLSHLAELARQVRSAY
ncbi:LLM class F420-dependent oxidoreductase [Streptomyces sp. WAC05374]|uniref:LLM class F420-dependent oxidoreductase n=1 Tax=Streptomyces sp. WAC05374 TaxID=2487420 RepID=UPI000F882B82|nr:LLM class F420-dependent oxidoreductase [Streptomyces sp. WAC05374]RST05324.1 LLM class F420-dependent oxidoreductase [Streptomyces sp. WAC05374]TDF46977.1 LLM class F420-dependent oxidoreductase [Streptomyces sp. WAC05374]TDF57232.1 LLM class F420-dependent oxidoreductase [Streptomyces sp. WAC05374]TDF61335.1 LLM class F420-dependent oxidoreductase [Streptomyces sp. WAC05374]